MVNIENDREYQLVIGAYRNICKNDKDGMVCIMCSLALLKDSRYVWYT